MANSKVQGYVDSIQDSLEKILETVQGQSEEVIRWKPSEEEWSILQILSHVNEATPYWLGELETVLDAPGSEWGRGLQHPQRLAAVENPDDLKVDEVIGQFKDLKDEVVSRLGKVEDERLTEENPHRNFAKFGHKPISFLIEHFMVDHTEVHYNQIQRNLSKLERVKS